MKKITDIINEQDIEIAKSAIILNSCSINHFNEIKHFHPSGKTEPNGVYLERGYYFEECDNNKNAFIVSEKIHDEQYALSKYKGGMIVFSLDVNAEKMSDNKLVNKLKQFATTMKQRYFKKSIIDKVIKKFNADRNKLIDENIYAYTVGKMFNGRYLADDGKTFSEKSTSIEVNGLSSAGLLLLAEYLAKEFRQETVLVKDFNSDKIYLADAEKFTGSVSDLDKELAKLNK